MLNLSNKEADGGHAVVSLCVNFMLSAIVSMKITSVWWKAFAQAIEEWRENSQQPYQIQAVRVARALALGSGKGCRAADGYTMEEH